MKPRWIGLSAFVVLCSVNLLHAAVPATQPAVPDSFLRFVDDGHGGGSLQTADVAFKNRLGITVHLVGAIHIAEKFYYDDLNRQFHGYDAVLYELIKSKGTPLPKPGQALQSDNPISEVQQFLKDALDLDFQLEDVDYTAPNFVHADMDKETFERLQMERGQSFEQMILDQIIKAFTDPNAAGAQMSDEEQMQDLVKILTSPDMERQIKVVLAKQLGQMDLSAMGLDGPDGSVILTERNKTALDVLQKTILVGKRNIAVFYGAAHLPDMSKRLEALGFHPVSTHSNIAWDLTIRANQPSAIQKLMQSLMNSDDDKK